MIPIDELDIVIRRKGTKVSAGIPQLALWATAADAQAAMTALEQKRAAFLADAAEADALDDLKIGPYRSGYALPPRSVELRHFALKALIVVGLIAAAIALSAGVLAAKFEPLLERAQQIAADTQAKMQQYTKIGGAQFWEKLEHELDRAADPASDMPPEQKRKVLAQIHAVVERWRPFMAEIAPLFAEFQKTTLASPTHSEAQPPVQDSERNSAGPESDCTLMNIKSIESVLELGSQGVWCPDPRLLTGLFEAFERPVPPSSELDIYISKTGTCVIGGKTSSLERSTGRMVIVTKTTLLDAGKRHPRLPARCVEIVPYSPTFQEPTNSVGSQRNK